MFVYKDEWTDIFNRYAAGEKDVFREMSLQDRFDYAAWAAHQKGGKLGVLTSLGATAIVNLHAARHSAFDVPIVFINTGYHHPETLGYSFQLVLKDYKVLTSVPSSENQKMADKLVEYSQDEWKKPRESWEPYALSDFNDLAKLVKIDPRDRSAQDLKITLWATGRRRDQLKSRADLPIFRFDDEGTLLEFNPLADWSSEDVYAYQKQNDLLELQHPLVKQGATRIGYRWEGLQGKGECGMHAAQDDESGDCLVGKPLLPVQG
jgi:phosphoadenosine phosphosulfate reductase